LRSAVPDEPPSFELHLSMLAVVESTGGAQIGWVNASWPFARLHATAGGLSLKVFSIGSYEFTPQQVTAIVPHGSIPIVYRGVRIEHTREDYPERLIFWCFGSPARLIEEIHAAGFQPGAPTGALHRRRGMPFRWSAILGAIVAWNGALLLDGLVAGNFPFSPGLFSVLGLALVFVASLIAPRSARLQARLLRPGRHIGEVVPLLNLLKITSGLMLMMFTFYLLLKSSPVSGFQQTRPASSTIQRSSQQWHGLRAVKVPCCPAGLEEQLASLGCPML
jgi:hypothetical protein